MKTKTTQDDRILAIIEPIAKDMGYRIVRIRVQGGNRPTLQIMAERISDGSMNVQDCADLSREVSSTLEVEDPITDPYILEVSSPGLERPLTNIEDFETYVGQLAKLELDRLVEGRKRFRGILAGRDGDNIAIDLEKEDQTALIPFAWLAEAKLLITNDMLKASKKQSKKKHKAAKDA